MKCKNNGIITNIISMFSTTIIILLAYIIFNYAPFGNKSLAVMDAQIQYLDFFSFLKNVFMGKDSIFYSFNTTIGGPAIGVFGYYLASPINILLKFINDENIFLNIGILIKLAIASFTFSYFLSNRFEKKLKSTFNIILSVSYSLMQYTIAQASNIMWLDGVYMLPLICLGVYKLIKEKNIHFLSITVGLSIIFNWYTGGINCIFSIFYFIFELIINLIDEKDKLKNSIKIILKSCITYCISMIIGVMISCILFIPVVLSLMGGKGGTFDIALITNDFYGNILNTIESYHMGSVSTDKSLSIYCGVFPLLGVILAFTSKNVSNKRKIIFALMLIIMVLTCYYKPLFLLFSLFKNSTSYYFRYSYVVIFTFIYISTFGYLAIEKEQKNYTCKYATLFSILLIVLQFITKSSNIKYIYATIIFLLIDIYIVFKEKIFNSKKILCVILLILCFSELFLNIKIMFRNGNSETLYKDYSISEQKQINELKEYDVSSYRISQTLFRNYQNEDELPAYYNDALAYNYMSISGYTSSPDNNALELLSNLGYRTEGECITIVNTSILPVDSLLGVKYVLSDHEIIGLTKVDELGTYNGKSVYYNQYALDLSFATRNITEVEYNGNSFEYVNDLYSSLLGENVEVYKKANYTISTDRNAFDENVYKYTVENVSNDGEYSLYAYFPWLSQYDGKVYSNGEFITQYAKWLSPEVIYIPLGENDRTQIDICSKNEIETGEAQIYFVDFAVLKYATDKIKENKVEEINFEKNKISIKYNNVNNMENLLVTIPFAKGWKLKINGKEYPFEEYNQIMYINLLDGENDIELNYYTPGLKFGIAVSCFGIIITIIEIIYVRKRGMNVG